MRKIVLIAFITTLMTGCIPFLPGYGGARPSQEYYRDERYYGNGAYYATGHIPAEADPITEQRFRRDREGINDAVLYNCSLEGVFSSGDVQIL